MNIHQEQEKEEKYYLQTKYVFTSQIKHTFKYNNSEKSSLEK